MGQSHASHYDNLFRQALRIRLVEERIADLYPTDQIQSPVHLSIGQEHVSVAACGPLRKDDLVFGTYRGHALYLAKGGDLNAMMAELYGRTTGCGKGKAGSMHLCAPEVGMMGASAIVASTIPHAVGAALAAQLRNSGQVITCFFGEGATAEGVYHESLNFASVKKLPILWICENNDLAIYTRFKPLHSYEIYQHARSYGITSERIENGMDLENLSQVCKSKIEAIRNGSGPQFLEVMTYRYLQHVGPSEDYNLGYRHSSELDLWKARDPLVQDLKRVKQWTPEILREIDEAVLFAENSPFPTEKDLYEDVY